MPKQGIARHPSEIFGFPIDDNSSQARDVRQRFFCPFMNRKCDKKSRLISYPFGVCSVKWNQGVIALCPRRFLQREIVFKDVADNYFRDRHNLVVFSEVGLSGVGSFDYVMVRHRPLSSEIDDFVIIEFQTGQTTSTGALVSALKDFVDNHDIAGRSYSFGLNQYDIWKRTFTQILNKGIVLEHWGQKVYWVVQEPIYQYFLNRYGLAGLKFDTGHCTRFAVYDMSRSGGQYVLSKTRVESSTVDNMFRAFRKGAPVPKKNKFVELLGRKIKAQMQLRLDLSK